MKKIFILAVLLAVIIQSDHLNAAERTTQIEKLKSHKTFRKYLKNSIWALDWAALPLIATCSERTLIGITKSTITVVVAHYLMTAIRYGHSYLACYYFRQLYDKHVDQDNNLISGFDPSAHRYPYALNDREFIKYGFACGFSTTELVRLANKCARTEISRQLSDGKYFADLVAEPVVEIALEKSVTEQIID